MGLKVAMLSPWGKTTRCGIRTYTENLVNALVQLDVDVFICRWPRFGQRTPELIESCVLDKIPRDVDLIHCFPADTKVLTPTGGKKISSFNTGDLVFTHRGTLGKVTQVFRHPYTGYLIKLKAQYSPEVTVTPEHPFLAIKCNWKGKRGVHIERFFNGREEITKRKPSKPSWIKAEDLALGDFIAFPRLRETYDIDSLRLETECLNSQFYGESLHYVWSHVGGKDRTIPKSFKVTPDFCRLLGYYIAEGNCRPPQLRFSFNRKEKEYYEDVEKLMKTIFGLEASVYEQGQGICLTFSFKPVAKLFGELCGVGARNKHLPSWALTLPVNKQLQLLKGLWRGDGSLVRDGFSLTTFSEALMEQLRLLLTRLGIPVGIYPKAGIVKVCGSGIKTMEKILGVNHPWKSKWGFRDFAHIDDHFIYYRIRQKSMIPFQGEVYNLEVSPENSYVISGYTVHNCQNEYGLFVPNLEGGVYAYLKRLGKPLVTTCHATGDFTKDSVIASVSDCVIVHNEWLARLFGHPEKAVIIPHGCLEPVDCPPAEECKKALGIDPRIPIVGYVGFISPPKGLETLIEAMTKVPNAALLIGGGWHVEAETDYLVRLKQWSLEVLKERCMWLGYVPDERLRTVYGCMSCLVYPSRWASESGALLTALSHGKAVLASNLPPFKEKEKAGALMTFRSVADLAKKIKRLLKDEALRKSLEEGARKYAQENSWNRVAQLHKSLYEDVIEKHK
jgi:glycosyltransferase involved in cell wall biosynthesis